MAVADSFVGISSKNQQVVAVFLDFFLMLRLYDLDFEIDSRGLSHHHSAALLPDFYVVVVVLSKN